MERWRRPRAIAVDLSSADAPGDEEQGQCDEETMIWIIV